MVSKARLFLLTFNSLPLLVRGQAVLRDNPPALDAVYLEQFEEFREFTNYSSEEQRITQEEDQSLLLTTTPEETLDKAIALLEASLRDELIDNLSSHHERGTPVPMKSIFKSRKHN